MNTVIWVLLFSMSLSTVGALIVKKRSWATGLTFLTLFLVGITYYLLFIQDLK